MTEFHVHDWCPIPETVTEVCQTPGCSAARRIGVLTYDPVHHPSHYVNDRFGCECIDLARRFTFNAGNAIKYVWRHEEKGNPLQDLEKSLVYLNWAIEDWDRGIHPMLGNEFYRAETNALIRQHVHPYLRHLPEIYQVIEGIAAPSLPWAGVLITGEIARRNTETWARP